MVKYEKYNSALIPDNPKDDNLILQYENGKKELKSGCTKNIEFTI